MPTRILPLFPLLIACQDYHLLGKDGEPRDSGEGLPEESSWSVGPLAPLPVVPADSDAPTCALEPMPAAPYKGQPSCTPLSEVTWDVVLEQDLLPPEDSADGGNFGSPVIGPGRDGNPTVFVAVTTSDFSGLATLEVISQEFTVPIQGIPCCSNDGSVAARGSRPDAWNLTLATYAADGPRVAIADLTAGTLVVSSEQDQGWGVSARDIDHDGMPEIFGGTSSYTLDATTLHHYTNLDFTLVPTVADSDGDGMDEVINAAGWWDAITGHGTEWRGLASAPEFRYFTGGLVSYLDDVVFAGHDGASHFVGERDGTVRWADPPEDGDGVPTTGSPCALGDVDGDSVPELAVRMEQTTVLRDLDGSIRWQVQTDNWFSGGVAMADLDADGRYEVIDWGVSGLWILRGADGKVLTYWTEGGTRFGFMAQAVGDIDGDGSAEIVLTGDPDILTQPIDEDTSNNHLFILGPAQGRWARTRPVWNQLSYDVTSVRDDGRVPAFPRANHETYNSWRAQPAHDGDHPDLEIEVLETCRDEAAGTVQIHTVVRNRGSKDAPAGAVVRLMSWDETLDQGLQDQASHTIADPIPSMTSAQGVVFEVTTEQWATRQVVQVDGTHSDECDFVNDRVDVWEE
jgi:hypothetical protein